MGAGSHLGTPGGPTQHETNRTARCQPEKFPPLYKKEMSCSPNPNCYTPPPPKSPIPLPLTSPSDSTLSLSLSLSLSPPATPKERQTTRRSRSPPPPVCSPGRLSGPPFRRRRYSPPLRYPLRCCACALPPLRGERRMGPSEAGATGLRPVARRWRHGKAKSGDVHPDPEEWCGLQVARWHVLGRRAILGRPTQKKQLVGPCLSR